MKKTIFVHLKSFSFLNDGNSLLVQGKIKQLLADIQSGSFRALARGITIVENELNGYEDLLGSLRSSTGPAVIGITGPPGAGKSTLVNALLDHWIPQGKKIAIIAVDPSSPFNFGALLGDRIRMSSFYNNPNVYIRSLASRGALGGLSAKILEVTDLVRAAPFDHVLVETVGVGQSEVEIAGLANCTIVALVPEAGDEVQTLKAGLMEIAEIFVVNKSDRDLADRLFISLKAMVHAKATKESEIPVIKTVASSGEGIPALAETIDKVLQSQKSNKEARVQFLTEKVWHLIQSKRMKDLAKPDICRELAIEADNADFNLYSFVQRYI